MQPTLKLEYFEDSVLFRYSFTDVGETEFTIPFDGYYTLKVWGAQGGKMEVCNEKGDILSRYTREGGYGGYSQRSCYVQKGTKVYVNIGGVGTTKIIDVSQRIEGGTSSTPGKGGYNGGGDCGFVENTYIPDGNPENKPVTASWEWGGGGGGATHIALSSGELKKLSSVKDDVLVVAGGGGGSKAQLGAYYLNLNTYSGKSGGGKTSENSTATQTEGFEFGQGASGISNASVNPDGGSGWYGGYPSGGGGWYGGYYGDGGSGYFGGQQIGSNGGFTYGLDKETEECVSDNPIEWYAKKGNGAAEIYFIAFKYRLYENDGKIYTVRSEQIENGSLSRETFESEGDSRLLYEYNSKNIAEQINSGNFINPKICIWNITDVLPFIKTDVIAVPFLQTTVTDPIYLTDPDVLGVRKVTINCKGTPRFACSVDNGINWHIYNGKQWEVSADVANDMDVNTLRGIKKEQWEEFLTNEESFIIRFTLFDENDIIKQITVDYVNAGDDE